MKQQFEAGASEKEAIAIDKEMNRLDLLEKHKHKEDASLVMTKLLST